MEVENTGRGRSNPLLSGGGYTGMAPPVKELEEFKRITWEPGGEADDLLPSSGRL